MFICFTVIYFRFNLKYFRYALEKVQTLKKCDTILYSIADRNNKADGFFSNISG